MNRTSTTHSPQRAACRVAWPSVRGLKRGLACGVRRGVMGGFGLSISTLAAMAAATTAPLSTAKRLLAVGAKETAVLDVAIHERTRGSI